MLWVAFHFPNLPPKALEPIAAWACQFTPRVSLEPPRELVLEAQASLRYFGGRAAFLEKLRSGMDELGWEVSLATAPTARAALWFARSGERRLEDVPLEATGFELELFRNIGIATVGELLRLPREGLARRCGQPLLDELDRALGKSPEPRELFMPPPRFSAELELPGPVTHAEALLFGARRLLVQLEGLLAARQAGIRAFTLILEQHETQTRLDIGLASAARSAERMTQLLCERLGNVSLQQPVEALRLEADHFTPLHERTVGMFRDRAAEAEGWARLAERLQARLGHDALYGLTTQPDHRPEYAWRRVEPGEWDPREFRQPGPRPAWLLETPRRLAEQEFELLVGPERIESGWWDGDDAKRDYFIAQHGHRADGAVLGSLVWVYREAGEWYLHGFFA